MLQSPLIESTGLVSLRRTSFARSIGGYCASRTFSGLTGLDLMPGQSLIVLELTLHAPRRRARSPLGNGNPVPLFPPNQHSVRPNDLSF